MCSNIRRLSLTSPSIGYILKTGVSLLGYALSMKYIKYCEPVGLVDHEAGPGEGVELDLVLEQDLVSSEQGVELGSLVARMNPFARSNLEVSGSQNICI